MRALLEKLFPAIYPPVGTQFHERVEYWKAAFVDEFRRRLEDESKRSS